jgi:death-on-curing protein
VISAPVRFLTEAHVHFIHEQLLAADGRTGEGLRDPVALAAAVAAPEFALCTEDPAPSLYALAALLAERLILGRPFADGNRRTALGAVLTFLELNGISLRAAPARLTALAQRIAEREVGRQQIASELRDLRL